MPLHDWTRVDHERYHDFHNQWITHITAALNGGMLPGDFEAVSESTVNISRDDPDEDDGHRFPDVGTLRFDDAGYGEEVGTAVAVAEAPPRVAVELAIDHAAPRQKRVLIRRNGGDLVAAIEVASNSNLRTLDARRDLAKKCRELLLGGVHACVFDPFPVGGRRPTVEELTVGEVVDEWSEVRETDQGLAASYVSGGPGRMRKAYLQPLTVGQPLPEMPVFLTSGTYVSLPLEPTYANAFAGVGRSVRRMLEAAS